jgi:hypothetical protein
MVWVVLLGALLFASACDSTTCYTSPIWSATYGVYRAYGKWELLESGPQEVEGLWFTIQI